MVAVPQHHQRGRPDPRYDRLYAFDAGLLYLSAAAAREVKRPREAVVSIAISPGPLELRTGAHTFAHAAVAVRSLVRHSLSSSNVPYASVLVAPSDPHFRAFRAIPAPGVLALRREGFGTFDEALLDAHRGYLSVTDAERLFQDIVRAAAAQLPAPKPLDPRISRVMLHLDRNPDCRLEELADSVYLSYYRMSHLFSQSVGLSLRSYQLWRKLHNAIALLVEGHKQCDVAAQTGFTDTAHFHRVCYETYGFRPAFLSSGVQSLRSSPHTHA